MRSLAELENTEVFEQFVEDAVKRTRERAGVATAEPDFGGNSGVKGRDGETEANVDAWFASARW